MSAAGRPLGCTHRRRLAGTLEGWRRCGQRGLRGGLLYFHGPFWGTAVTGCWGKCSPRPLPTATRPATHHTHPLPPTSPFTDALSCASLAGGGSHRLGEEHAVQDPAQLCSAVRLGASHGGSGHRWVGEWVRGWVGESVGGDRSCPRLGPAVQCCPCCAPSIFPYFPCAGVEGNAMLRRSVRLKQPSTRAPGGGYRGGVGRHRSTPVTLASLACGVARLTLVSLLIRQVSPRPPAHPLTHPPTPFSFSLPGQGSITVPGCLAATPIEAPIDVEEGFPGGVIALSRCPASVEPDRNSARCTPFPAAPPAMGSIPPFSPSDASSLLPFNPCPLRLSPAPPPPPTSPTPTPHNVHHLVYFPPAALPALAWT